MITSIRTGQRR